MFGISGRLGFRPLYVLMSFFCSSGCWSARPDDKRRPRAWWDFPFGRSARFSSRGVKKKRKEKKKRRATVGFHSGEPHQQGTGPVVSLPTGMTYIYAAVRGRLDTKGSRPSSSTLIPPSSSRVRDKATEMIRSCSQQKRILFLLLLYKVESIEQYIRKDVRGR